MLSQFKVASSQASMLLQLIMLKKDGRHVSFLYSLRPYLGIKEEENKVKWIQFLCKIKSTYAFIFDISSLIWLLQKSRCVSWFSFTGESQCILASYMCLRRNVFKQDLSQNEVYRNDAALLLWHELMCWLFFFLSRFEQNSLHGNGCCPASYLGHLGWCFEPPGAMEIMGSSGWRRLSYGVGDIWLSTLHGICGCSCSMACNKHSSHIFLVGFYKGWCWV